MASIKQKLNNFYQKLCATKVHLWSHYLALLGWSIFFFIILLNIISNYNEEFLFTNLSYIIFASIIILLIISVFILVKTHFSYFIIKPKLILTNLIYHLFWLSGFIMFVIFLLLIILHPVYATLIHLFLSIF